MLVVGLITISLLAIHGVSNYSDSAKVYKNSVLGFELVLEQSWRLPDELDYDPHFFFDGCSTKCPAFEIQNHDIDFTDDKAELLTDLVTQERNPQELTSLIPSAVVIKSDAPERAEGWKYQYDVFFPAEKRRFLIFSNSEHIEKDVLSRFRLSDAQQR